MSESISAPKSGMQGDMPPKALDELLTVEDLSEREDERETMTKVMTGPESDAPALKGWNNDEGEE